MRRAIYVRFALLALLFACVANAHERSESTSHWIYANGDLHGVITTRTREVTRLTVPGDSYASLAQIFSAHVERSVEASVDGTPCAFAQAPNLLGSEPGYLRVDVRLHCNSGNVLILKLGMFFAVAPSHHHFLYLESRGESKAESTDDFAGASREAILTAASPSVEIELHASQVNKTHFLQFVAMGIEHIATGIDHLAFLLALLIGARSARQILAIVTGFTIGHSLTLSLAVLGVVQANRGAVECLIGLTIALAAAQNLIRGEREGRLGALGALAITASMLLIPPEARPDMSLVLITAIGIVAASSIWLASSVSTDARQSDTSISSRFIMAMGFGLIHGLGFASALQDLHLPRSLLVPTLFGFNVGVEIGQLVVVAAVLLMIRIAAVAFPAVSRSKAPATLTSALLLCAGLAWFLTRAVIVY